MNEEALQKLLKTPVIGHIVAVLVLLYFYSLLREVKGLASTTGGFLMGFGLCLLLGGIEEILVYGAVGALLLGLALIAAGAVLIVRAREKQLRESLQQPKAA